MVSAPPTSSDIRVIITAYQTEKVSDDHPYIWRYTARRALVIFDHPYNAEYEWLTARSAALAAVRRLSGSGRVAGCRGRWHPGLAILLRGPVPTAWPGVGHGKITCPTLRELLNVLQVRLR
jgi:hypothetical protein